ncbi:hypothetical protein RHMOL_Rhmol01G0086300 [Rhododendron molle]|uniref:Uncharacterized protein n=1 Tax=Rhododendron molle TaxID=49168 RepID=A0ACC0PZ48_RHOML|nr:hypothetical protein RHMOL_Rhmol01G0086300 [Rhododendron molle]
MNMIMESMQEISDKLQTRPQPERLKKEVPAADPNMAALIAKIGKLEESVQETKRLGKWEIDMSKLCLFPNAKLPEKFKGVDFVKFDGTGDPRAISKDMLDPSPCVASKRKAVEEALRDGTLEKKELGSGSKSKRAYSGNSNILFENTNQAGTSSTKPVEVNQISEKSKSQSRTFTQFITPKSTILKKLTEIGVLKPLRPPQTIPPNLNQNVYCNFHQMPDHTTDNCIRLRHEIQNLIDSKVFNAPPPDKPNTVSNPLPQHNAPFHINQITLTKNQNLSEFDPTLFIVPDTESKPIVEIPKETALCFLWEWEDT